LQFLTIFKTQPRIKEFLTTNTELDVPELATDEPRSFEKTVMTCFVA